MNDSIPDLDAYGLRLLKFVEDSVNEAIEDASSRAALLSEANCALRVLKRTLHREAPTKFGQFALIEGSEWDLEQVFKDNPLDFSEKLREALGRILEARQIIFGAK
jgi:hypothetical protein